MSNAATARGAYRRAMAATAGPRSIEAEAFENVSAALARSARGSAADYPAYVAALSRNLSLWTILAADVARDDNRLDAETRSRIWNLATFVRQHTTRLLQSGVAADVGSFLAINAAIATGLRSGPSRGRGS